MSDNYQNKPFYPQLKHFSNWLKERGYAPATIRQLSNYAGDFLAWLASKALKVGQVSYADMMAFISHCGKESPRLISRKLSAIRKYYEHLQEEGVTDRNPAAGLYLKGKKTTVPRDLLEREALEHLYDNYHVTDKRSQRNKVILGLLIYQGLSCEALHKLEPGHLRLKAGRIDIPPGGKTSGRTLTLEPQQIIELHEYVNHTRPAILAKIHANDPGRAGRKPNKIHHSQLDRQLFVSMNGSANIKRSLMHLIEALQQINKEVKSAAQIRQSVIAGWLKIKDPRTVQYMAGHRYVSSTERYQGDKLEALEQALQLHHPLEEEGASD